MVLDSITIIILLLCKKYLKHYNHMQKNDKNTSKRKDREGWTTNKGLIALFDGLQKREENFAAFDFR